MPKVEAVAVEAEETAVPEVKVIASRAVLQKAMGFIEDANRQKIMEKIRLRIPKNRSVLVHGDYGVGKSTFVGQVVKELRLTHTVVEVRPLGSVCQLLGEMCGVMDVEVWKKNKYLQTLCDHPRVIVIDEAQHLTPAIYPYLKLIMEAGNIVIFSGLTDLVDSLRAKHPDVLSRMVQLKLLPISLAEFKKATPDFEEEAMDSIYGYSESARVTIEMIEYCRDYAAEKGIEMITANIADLFIED